MGWNTLINKITRTLDTRIDPLYEHKSKNISTKSNAYLEGKKKRKSIDSNSNNDTYVFIFAPISTFIPGEKTYK